MGHRREPDGDAGIRIGVGGAAGLTVDGVRLPLASVTAGTKTEAFSAPAVFQTSNPASRLYASGDTVVTVGDAPLWDGWQAVMTAYLGLSGSSYTLTGGSWDGDFQQEGDNYTRMAIYTGTRQTPVWTATYQTEPEYTAEITYTDSQYPDGLYEMEPLPPTPFRILEVRWRPS